MERPAGGGPAEEGLPAGEMQAMRQTAAVRRRLPHIQPAAGSAVPGQQVERVIYC